ncbi:MAG TPA: M15 family metallopeptidase [Pyrinomonadaceae bacterium]|jgi:uncharacterized protein YcbK (DUF882 family)
MVSKKQVLFSLSAGALFGAVLLSFAFVKLAIRGQNTLVFPAANAAESDRPTIAFVNKTDSTTTTAFNAAAIENSRLMNALGWTFGAKAQRGWQIYVPLIQHTIGTEKAPQTPEFAIAVAAWQQKFGLAPTGKIDAETLLKMVGWWQSRRLNSSRYPSDEELVTAPITDFYDPSRAPELLKVERETYAAYKKMIAAATKDLNLKTTKTGELAAEEKFLRIVSAFRSREYQAKLRAASPHSGRAGLAVNSPHFTGQALDIYVGGEPTITKDFNRSLQVRTPAYKWLVKNAERFGFYPYYYEPWHWEYVSNNLRK